MRCKYNNCKHCGYKSECEIFKENAELKEENKKLEDDNDYLISELKVKALTNNGLIKENTELRHQLNKNPCVCNTEWHCNDCLEQHTKAKELLAKWVELYKPKLEGYPITPIQEQTEQFLNSEVDK